jgi:hypothetical protein
LITQYLDTMQRKMSTDQRKMNNDTRRYRYKYVQEKMPEPELKIVNNDDNFPKLGKAVAKKTAWSGKKFTELATDWKEEDEEKKLLSMMSSSKEEISIGFVMPQFNPTRRFVDEEEVPQVASSPVQSEDDSGWTTVDRTNRRLVQTVHRLRRKDEYLERLDNGEEPVGKDDNNDDTAWGDQLESHETYWDQRP